MLHVHIYLYPSNKFKTSSSLHWSPSLLLFSSIFIFTRLWGWRYCMMIEKWTTKKTTLFHICLFWQLSHNWISDMNQVSQIRFGLFTPLLIKSDLSCLEAKKIWSGPLQRCNLSVFPLQILHFIFLFSCKLDIQHWRRKCDILPAGWTGDHISTTSRGLSRSTCPLLSSWTT